MEKKKLLLVAISVGVFLVISIGAAILIFIPKNAAPSSGAVTNRPVSGTVSGVTVLPPPSNLPSSEDSDADGNAPSANPAEDPLDASRPLDAVDLVRNSGEVPGLKPYPEGTIPGGTDYYVNGTGGGTVISVPKPSTAAVPDAAPAGRAAPSAAPRPAPVTPAPRPAPAAVKAPAPAASQSKPAVQTKIYDDYWVQTGAFSTIAKAEGVKETLSTKGITSIIENRDVEGRSLFRVRVGPYTSQNEANYWLSLIKTIDGFEDSQVRLTQSRR